MGARLGAWERDGNEIRGLGRRWLQGWGLGMGWEGGWEQCGDAAGNVVGMRLGTVLE